MSYSNKNYPASMKNLMPEIREKAIEILNALIEKKEMDTNVAIPTSISRAKDWAANRGIDVSPSSSDDKNHGEDVYVIPVKKGWAIKKEKEDQQRLVFDKKKEAVSNAKKIALEKRVSLIVQKRDGKIQSKISYTR